MLEFLLGLALVIVGLVVALPSCETWSRQEKGAAIGAGAGLATLSRRSHEARDSLSDMSLPFPCE